MKLTETNLQYDVERGLYVSRLAKDIEESTASLDWLVSLFPLSTTSKHSLAVFYADQLIAKYEAATAMYGTPILFSEAVYAIMNLHKQKNYGSNSLLAMGDRDFLEALIENATDSFQYSVEQFQMADADEEKNTVEPHIYTYNMYGYAKNPLFFLELTPTADVREAVTSAILKLLDGAYADTCQESTEWALEYQLWARMLLDERPAIMLNPQFLDIHTPDGGDTVADKLISCVGLLAPKMQKTYMSLLHSVDELKLIFDSEEAPEDFYIEDTATNE